MDITQDEIDGLVSSLSESLSVEVKRWIDPRLPSGAAKIIQATIALRNRNGGYLVVGFDDTTLLPDLENELTDVFEAFHADVVQGIVSKYASIPFEVLVGFARFKDRPYPVIKVPAGVTVPVATKRELTVPGGNSVLKDRVYFRTLNSNGRVSSAPALASDWKDIVDICFDNREADIGRFLRRHLGGESLTALLQSFGAAPAPPTMLERLTVLMAENEDRRDQVLSSSDFATDYSPFADMGSWSAMAIIDPPISEGNDIDFLNKVASSNPRYTGWPVWLDSRNFYDQRWKPRKVNSHWETTILSGHVDFYRIRKTGEFYLWRILQDDLTDKVPPRTKLDPILVLWRVAETLAVLLAFARELGASDDAEIHVLFKWSGIAGRELEAWSDWSRYISAWDPSYVDSETGYVQMRCDTPINSLAPLIKSATDPMLSSFGGHSLSEKVIEGVVQKVLSRTF
ncbi:putative transcriptional regulator [Agrobacterium pusense]|uniref:Transcriptional regulator n=1 Tax=Agrobacterium pusense TaxID=648995 RepID=U4PUI0_9HYPH|nr:putative transcriptional regulator [Agrobacterium pusense]CDI08774.1 putative transcriptional regulator [Agrobacterium pusense]